MPKSLQEIGKNALTFTRIFGDPFGTGRQDQILLQGDTVCEIPMIEILVGFIEDLLQSEPGEPTLGIISQLPPVVFILDKDRICYCIEDMIEVIPGLDHRLFCLHTGGDLDHEPRVLQRLSLRGIFGYSPDILCPEVFPVP